MREADDRVLPATTSQLIGVVGKWLANAFDVIEQTYLAPTNCAIQIAIASELCPAPGLTATDVELMVINGYRVNRFTKGSHPSTYRSSQVPMSVMLGDILRCWHRVPLEKVGAISESKGILVYRFELVHVVLTQAPIVRFESKADVTPSQRDVCFAPKSGH